MNNDSIIFIGLDTHKSFIQVAVLQEQRGATPEHLGRIKSNKSALIKLTQQLQSKYPKATLHFVYEAGPCGYWTYRLLTSLGHCCCVIAPSLIPKKSGDRVKTDKRDAAKLAKLFKAEELTPIYVPESEDEAIRDLSRARETAMKDLKDAKFQLKGFLLRNNVQATVNDNWSKKHLRWLTDLILPHHSQQIVLQEMIITISERMQRLQRLDNELLHQVKNWRYYPVVKAIQAMRGCDSLLLSAPLPSSATYVASTIPEKLWLMLDLYRLKTPVAVKRNEGASPNAETVEHDGYLLRAHILISTKLISPSNCNCDKKDCPKKLSILLGMLSNDYVAAINDYYKKANIETLSSPLSQEK